MPTSLRHLRRFVMPRPPPGHAGRFLSPLLRFRLAFAPLRRLAQRYLQLFDRGLRKDDPVVAQQVIGMALVARDQFGPVEVRELSSRLRLPCRGTSTSSAVLSTCSLSSAARNALVFGSFTSKAFTTVSLPSANFAASAERSAPSSFLRGNL